MENNLEHIGTIVEIEGRRVEVRMVVDGACSSCKVKGACGASEATDKIVTVLTDHAEHYRVGEEVTVGVTKMMGVRAVIFAYVLPFFFMLGTLLLLLGMNFSDMVSGLSSLGVVGLYYIVLFMLRNKIEQDIVFKIYKI